MKQYQSDCRHCAEAEARDTKAEPMRDYYAPYRWWLNTGAKRMRWLKRELTIAEAALQTAESYVAPFQAWHAAGDRHLVQIMARHPRCTRCEVLVGPGHEEPGVVKRCGMCRDDLSRIRRG